MTARLSQNAPYPGSPEATSAKAVRTMTARSPVVTSCSLLGAMITQRPGSDWTELAAAAPSPAPRGLGVTTVETRLLEGIAWCAIIADAKATCDLIVMGTHGRSGLSHLFLGSVAEEVVRKAECPVLVVHAPH
jgi:nucleotide-binding universal stress UspA family protein